MSNSEAKLGQRFLIDTHVLDGTDRATARLWEMHDQGWIQLCRSDAMHTELMETADADQRRRLLSRSAEIVEVHGVGVLDPREAVGLWQRMGERGGEPPEFLSTHPSSETRVRELERLMPAALEIRRRRLQLEAAETGGS